MLAPAAFPSLSPVQSRAEVLAELRRLLLRQLGWSHSLQQPLSFGLAGLDCHLPNGGLANALHEVVPATQAALPAAFGFIVAVLGRFVSLRENEKKIIFVMPGSGGRPCGRSSGRLSGGLSGHGLNRLGFDPNRAILVDTPHRHDALWAVMEALRSGAPQAVVGLIDRLDLKTSQ